MGDRTEIEPMNSGEYSRSAVAYKKPSPSMG